MKALDALVYSQHCARGIQLLWLLPVIIGDVLSHELVGNCAKFRPVELDEDHHVGEGAAPVGATGHTLIRRKSSLWMYGGLIEWEVDNKNDSENSIRYGHALWQFEPDEMIWQRAVTTGAPRSRIKQHEKLEIQYNNELVIGEVVTPRTKHDQIEIKIQHFGKPKNLFIEPANVIYHPPAMQMHIAVISPDNTAMYIHPGKGPTEQTATELWSYLFDREVWIQVQWNADSEAPLPREMHSGVALGRGLLIFGGTKEDQIFDDLWHYSFGGDRWKKINARSSLKPRNSPLWGHSAITYDGKMWIFGGSSGSSEVNNHLWSFEWKTLEWRNHTSQAVGEMVKMSVPSARKGHTADVYKHCMVVYGGHDANASFMSDLWLLDLRTGEWSNITLSGKKPKSRNFHSAAIWDSTLFIHGGNCESGILSDFWSIDLSKFCK